MTADAYAVERQKARDYLNTRGTLAPAAEIRRRVAAAFETLESCLESVPAELAAHRALPGEWTVLEVVDHLLESARPGLDELRCLLAGRRPAGGPIPAALTSKDPASRPWPWLTRELARVHRDILETLDAVAPDFATDARAPLVMVTNARDAAGAVVPLHWVEDLDWKAYAIVFRLHAIDHLNQIKKTLAAAGAPGAR
jgi:hypothetical protein